MNTSRAFPTALVAFLVVAPLAAQSRADFSGRWVLSQGGTATMGGGRGDQNRNATGGGGGGGGGTGLGVTPQVELIRQDDSTMTVQEGDDGPFAVYRLDGKRTKNSVLVGQGRISEMSYVSRWEGQKLVTTMSRTVGTREVRTRETRQLSDDGTMVVEVRTEAGVGSGSNGRRVVYRKE